MTDRDAIDAALGDAAAHCARRGEQLTPLRRHVLELLMNATGPIKAYDLLAQLDQPGNKAKPPTIYRALDFLMNAGLAHKVEALNVFVACGHGHEDGGAELYICGDCGAVEERHGAPSPADAPEGFKIDHSVVEHYGHCGRCAH
tara:strand:- start:82 stop:513 length:432 start_codon:yes stop_codon:yes gene_type:complete